MNFLAGFGRGLLTFVLAISLSAWIWLATAQATLLNRQAVMGWLENSQAYDNFGDVVRAQTASQTEENAVLNQEAIQQALGNTLTPGFLKRSAETAINATYDWLEGKADSINFSLSLTEKRGEFQTQLAKAMQDYASDLPTCSTNLSSNSSLCVPSGMSPETFAADYARRAVESSDFLSQPITPQGIGQAQQLPSLDSVLIITRNLSMIIWGLLGLTVLCTLGYVLLSPDKLKGLMIISRRIFFSVMLSTILGGLLFALGPNLQLGVILWDATVTNKLVIPLIHQILPSLGMWLLIYAGGTMALSGATWLTSFLIIKKRSHTLPTATPPPKLPEPESTHGTRLPLS